MSLQGLPDFYQPMQAENLQVFYPYENAGDYLVLPNLLQIGNRLNQQFEERPDFTLTLVRGQNPALLPKPHGLLDFKLQPYYPLDAALTLIRDSDANATVQPITCKSGSCDYILKSTAIKFQKISKQPIPLSWNGLTTARYPISKFL
ncbi:MAG: hypothetical protein HC936_11735, partial [Leptolyngbyaceae cyanobacterium SU_3_3]|nr:hypothetical protein [Leptolyngbyaceae cyanobacterium SU_3_3]